MESSAEGSYLRRGSPLKSPALSQRSNHTVERSVAQEDMTNPIEVDDSMIEHSDAMMAVNGESASPSPCPSVRPPSKILGPFNMTPGTPGFYAREEADIDEMNATAIANSGGGKGREREAEVYPPGSNHSRTLRRVLPLSSPRSGHRSEQSDYNQGAPFTLRSPLGGTPHSVGRGAVNVSRSPKSPATLMAEVASAIVTSTARDLEKVWDEVGYSREERESQNADLISEFRKLCDKKLAEERGVATTFRQTIADAKEEIKRTCLALKTDADAELLKEGTGMALTDELANVEVVLERLRSAANTAREDLAASRDRLIEAHEIMGTEIQEEWKDIDSDLTNIRRAEFHDKVTEMNRTVDTRRAAIIRLLSDCQSYMKDLRIDGKDDPFCKKILSSLERSDDGSAKIVTDKETETCTGIGASALEALTKMVPKLSAERRRRKDKIGEMGVEISMLWEKLRISEEEQQAFTASVVSLGIAMETIEKGQNELRRLHNLKAEMIGKLIQEARNEIEELWNETNTSVEQREAFRPAAVTDEAELNDDLLEQHEQYIVELRNQLEQMRPILKIIEKREDILKERMAYEELQKDSDRLKQRGAALTKQLMQEEEMSKRIKKVLPKCTELLEKKLREWHKTRGEPFMYQGEPYLSVIDRQESEWRAYKENEMQLKLKKKQEEKALESARSGVYKPLPGRKKEAATTKSGTHSSRVALGDAKGRANAD